MDYDCFGEKSMRGGTSIETTGLIVSRRNFDFKEVK